MPSTIGVAEAATRSLATLISSPSPYPRTGMHSSSRCPGKQHPILMLQNARFLRPAAAGSVLGGRSVVLGAERPDETEVVLFLLDVRHVARVLEDLPARVRDPVGERLDRGRRGLVVAAADQQGRRDDLV